MECTVYIYFTAMGDITLDINCDLGEGLENDHLLMPYLNSCNIACGGHFGDEQTILAALNLAQIHQVKVGAHPSYPDQKNFGRNQMEIAEGELYISLLGQIQLFRDCCDELGLPLNHIKLHGALYNHASKDLATAELVCLLLNRHFPDTAIYGQSGSALCTQALAYQIPFLNEVFADRAYEADGSLVSRQKPDAVWTDPDRILKHVLEIVKFQRITAIDGTAFSVKADTICVHGDNPRAVEILKALRSHA
jgi:5-oxoprolinase (ATP-hydrolysing) subunit A